jgi:threonine/homoserine/homoserine lactone efflux protein
LRWIGGLYLIYLGIKLWRAPVVTPDTTAPALSLKRIFAHAYAVTALNPKSIIFFVAFVPQFIDPHVAATSQIIAFEATFVLLGTFNALCYAMLASVARRAIRSASVQRVVNRVGGSLLIGAGIFAATWKKASA